MRYQKAEQILPEALLKQIQTYTDGTCLYIPRKKGTRQNWGDSTQIREELSLRNRRIYYEHLHGHTVSELASFYYLSEKSIQRILREQKKLDNEPV